uniref:Myosin motor domain-containing protein n=1 Tax=Panagrolaimus sp. ES5 TaxID=591445 RepID=A0AC34F6A6_9BILA
MMNLVFKLKKTESQCLDALQAHLGRGNLGFTFDGYKLPHADEFFGLNPDELIRGLSSRVMQFRGGIFGTIIMVPARDALVKSVYSHLFNSIVSTVNVCIPFSNSTGYIGVLDIAGFVNTFEQFCINYWNEKLQQFFNERILKHEQELYRRDALNVPGIDYAVNQDCIELFEQKASGLLDLLDEEASLPRASALHYTEAVHKANARHVELFFGL